ncbi:hypothetical protein D3C84_1230650 [compost metagenome]
MPVKRLKCSPNWVTSSRPWVSRRRVRSLSPLAIMAMASTASCKGREMLRAMTTTSKVMTRAMPRPSSEASRNWRKNSFCMSSI